jgi:hypothetical protein
MFTGLVNWLLGVMLCIISLAGLFLAAKGGTNDSYMFGLSLFLLSLVGIASLVRHALDKADSQHH